MSQFVHMMVVAPQIYSTVSKVYERGLQMLQMGHF